MTSAVRYLTSTNLMQSGSRRFFFIFPVILRAQHTGKSVQGTKNHRPLAQLSPASTMPGGTFRPEISGK